MTDKNTQQEHQDITHEQVSLRVGIVSVQKDMEYVKKTLDLLGPNWKSDIAEITALIHELTGVVGTHSTAIQDHESRLRTVEQFKDEHKAFHLWFSRTIYTTLIGLIIAQIIAFLFLRH